MKKYRLLSWNINGIRAIHRKDLLPEAFKDNHDIICFQETKASEDQLIDDIKSIDGYQSHFSSAEKKGYSGVATYSRPEPLNTEKGIDNPTYDTEGRFLVHDYGDFILYNVYFPNGGASEERLQYKLNFYETFLDILKEKLREGKRIVICGDVNTAHKPIDLARPKPNEKNTGFLPIEREWIDKLLKAGFIDTFRAFDEGPDNYSWWDYKTRARERNVGWRIDYFFVSKNLKENMTKAAILPDIIGSDHCPVTLELVFD